MSRIAILAAGLVGALALAAPSGAMGPTKLTGTTGPGFTITLKKAGKMVKKILTWGLVAFLIFFIAYRPTNAAAVFRQLGSSLYDVATGLGQFFSNLVA